METKSYRERYDEIYRKYPEELFRIKGEISNKIDYEFIEPYYIRNEWLNCIDYGKIIPKIKWPDDKMKVKLQCALFEDGNSEKIPFLIAGTVVKVGQRKDGGYIVYLSDDEELWNNPDDYDRLLYIKDVLNITHCMVAYDLFGEEEYSIGKVENLRPGTRVMMTAFFLDVTQNENWLSLAFSDIKRCSKNISRNREYYDVCLNTDFRMITKEEYYQEFFNWVEYSAVIPESLKNTSQNNSDGCYIATCVYGSYDCPQVWTLRRYRDFTLYKTWYGRAFIRMYYTISPKLVELFGHNEWIKKIWRRKLDGMVKRLRTKGIENTPYNDRDY